MLKRLIVGAGAVAVGAVALRRYRGRGANEGATEEEPEEIASPASQALEEAVEHASAALNHAREAGSNAMETAGGVEVVGGEEPDPDPEPSGGRVTTAVRRIGR